MYKYILKILALLTKREKQKLFLVLLGMIAAGFFEVLGVGSILPFVSLISRPDIIHTNKYLISAYNILGFTSDSSFIFIFGIGVIVFLFLSNLVRTLSSYMVKRYSAMRNHSFSVRLLQMYISQPYAFFLDKNSSELVKNILGEVNVVIRSFLMPFLEMIINIIIGLFIVSMLLFVQPVLTIAVAGLLSLIYISVFFVFRNILKRLGAERLASNSQRFKYANEVLTGIKSVKILGRESIFLGLFAKPSKKLNKNQAFSDIIGVVPKYMIETFVFGGILLIILYLFRMEKNMQDILPILSLFIFAGYRLMPAMQKIFNSLTKLKFNTSVVDLVYDHLMNYQQLSLPGVIGNSEKLIFEKEIKLNKLSFTYNGTTESVIKDQSLTIKANTTVGIVGSTGCGKTTLVDIILGLLEPQKGQILIDGVKISSENRRNWQANLGYVPQSIFLTDDTIASNVAFGVPEDKVDMGLVRAVVGIADLSKFIEEELTDGYRTVVGDRGIRLSGGQRQRIGIARSLYFKPSVLILDEASSALDGLTEKAIMDSIYKLSHKITIIMIAHRLTTIKECDMIYYMDKGTIVDSGTYDELIKQNKNFRQMAEGVN